MRDSPSSNILRPTIADVVTDLQLLKAAEILREKSCASAHSLASVLSVIRYVLGKPYFPESVFGNKKSVAFDFRGQSCVVEFASCENSKRSFQNVPATSLEAGRNSTSPSVLLQPTIADILSDPQTLRLIEVLKEKSKESPSKLASLLCIVKAVLDDVGLKGLLFSNKITFTHLISSSSSSTREYTVEFEDQQRNSNVFPASQFNNEFLPNGSNSIMNNVSEIHVFKPPLTSDPHSNHHNHHHHHHHHHHQQQQQQQQHDEDEDMMDELEKDEIVEETQPETEIWRHAPTPTKRKRNSDSPSDEDHCAPPSTSKRRSTDKHKAPPLSCEAVKRLFTGITKAMLLQRLEESKALISSIKESYSGIRPPNTSSNLSSSPRLNLLCHLLQSPPTSRIDGISSKVFSNLELYKLFTTYNSYKEEVAQSIHPDQINSPNKRNHTSSPSSTDPSPITFPTYSSFIDPTVTLHIKEQTGGKEVGKHRLNCAWRLSILCELLGKGVLLMTKELSGAKLERILVEEFSKLVDFLKNPENQDWVATVREKMELVGFDEVYEPLDEADIGDNVGNNNNSNNNGSINHVVATSGGPIGSDLIKQGGGHNDNGHVGGVQQVIFLDPNMPHQISSQQQDKRIAVSTTDDAMNNVSYGQRYSESVNVSDPTLKDDAIAVRSSPSRPIYNKR